MHFVIRRRKERGRTSAVDRDDVSLVPVIETKGDEMTCERGATTTSE